MPTKMTGCVFRIKHDDQGTIFEHWGSNAGFTSYMVGSLAQRQGLVLMTNSDNGFALMAAIARTLAHHYNWPVLKPRQLEPVTLATQQLSAYVGTFATASQPDTAMQFLHLNDTLMLITKYQPKRPLIPVGKALFFDPESSSTFEFLQGRDEAVGWVRVTEASGYNNDFPKVEH
ncbi:hypothetical protein [Bowmanella yangjiangensis]|uniref:Beta-lactamase-related domain-containing protein n=1 Tax=Bowmanella yangjiangensis TaxID=2811230 RepID=A0ABS3CTP1_9ALTE|nr:hypothetical protein [Bowmanella yangjiangensis]MBN7820492.1 hypothetical protein [Bowmanella yangjiangensis]